MILKQRLSQDIIEMVNNGAKRDDIMIHLGMLLMLETLQDKAREPKLHGINEFHRRETAVSLFN